MVKSPPHYSDRDLEASTCRLAVIWEQYRSSLKAEKKSEGATTSQSINQKIWSSWCLWSRWRWRQGWLWKGSCMVPRSGKAYQTASMLLILLLLEGFARQLGERKTWCILHSGIKVLFISAPWLCLFYPLGSFQPWWWLMWNWGHNGGPSLVIPSQALHSL